MRSAIASVLIFASFQSLNGLSSITNSRLNYFDIDLLRYAAEDKSGNVMVSPASIKSTLAMILEGAHGTTADQIQSALRLLPNKKNFREELSIFLKALQINTPSLSLQNANGLFVSEMLNLKNHYEKIARSTYLSDVNKLDFNDPKTAADAINRWVNIKTHGKIPSIVDQEQIDPLAELLVTNALYFKGTWLHQFEVNLTHGDCFYNDGVCRTVAMMDLQAELNYAYVENLRAHALELPYKGKHYSMILLVPQDRKGELALIRDLPYIGVPEIINEMEPSEVILTMPKFTVEYSDDLVPALKHMHITDLFSPFANLSGILEGTTGFLSNIYHKVHMSVDETGTVAAAASAGMVVPLINDEIQLRVDRPFLFFIIDNERGVVLFEGKIEEPTEFVAAVQRNGYVEYEDQRQGQGQNQDTSQSIQPNLGLNQFEQSHSVSSKRPIQSLRHQLSVSQPTSSPVSNQPIWTQPPQEDEAPYAKKSYVSWYSRLSGYFG